MPTPLDIGFALLFTVVVTVFDTTVFVPRFKAEVAAGVPGARRRAYRRTVVGQWAFAFAATIIWMRSGRPWSELGVVPPAFVRTAVSAVIIALIGAFTVQQMRAVARLTAKQRDGLRTKLARLEFLLPHSRGELAWFTTLAITAGICEELLYRGFLLWLLEAYVGIAVAAVLGVVLFGLGHLYQGRQGAMKAAAAAAAMTTIYLGTGWLLPAMVVHALIDVNAGVLGFRVLGDAGDALAVSGRAD